MNSSKGISQQAIGTEVNTLFSKEEICDVDTSGIELSQIKSLLDFISTSSITEIEISRRQSKLRIIRSTLPMASATTPINRPACASYRSASGKSPVVDLKKHPPSAAYENVGVIKSSMVGTCFLVPLQGRAFAEIGNVIDSKDTVCLIKAMNLTHDIKAGLEGVIKEVLVKNGQPVEYGQPLFVVGLGTKKSR
jgi:acetyl-CoA carboxylase biotin carboxyl carrier protein